MNNNRGKIGLLVWLFIPFIAWSQNNVLSDTEDCSGTRPPFAFTIQSAWTSSTTKKVDTRYTPVAGDIDDDGNVEIITANGVAGGGGILYVFEGKTGALAGQLNCSGVTTSQSNGILIFRRDSAAKVTLFVAGRNGTIYLYEVDGPARPLTFTLVWSRALNTPQGLPVAADLDGNGTVEIIQGNYIIDANTGNTLATLQYAGAGITLNHAFPITADLDGDGHPEIAVGTHVYKYAAGTGATLWRVCPGFTAAVGEEGNNIAADVNQDGIVDLVYQNPEPKSGSTPQGFIRVWTPLTNQNLGDVATNLPGHARSYPFVGDIDGVVIGGKKYPEICVNTVGQLRAYTYNGTSFSQKWTMNHSDMSGGTALTLFDFNLDGVVELVYRDQTELHIFDGSGAAPVNTTAPIACGSATIVETPIIADVTGDGSADIIVPGDPLGASNALYGELMVFEGSASKWASCPSVWNQQMYSPLLVNLDLTIPRTVQQPTLTFTLPNSSTVQYYNGGPMQAPYISESTYWPVDISPDVYVVSGTITINSPTSVTLTVIFGNQGMAVASASTPIRYYKDGISTANILGSEVLGVDLAPGQTKTITKVLSGLSNPMPSRFYVRILDDGTNFPAAGAYSDCNLSNNQKSFGTLELLKTVDSQNACVDGTSIFHVTLVNNTNQTSNPQTFNNIVICDSLGNGWQFISDTVSSGTLTAYNATTRKVFWSISSIAPGDTVWMRLVAKATTAGSIRNSSWVESVGGVTLGREVIEAYVIVNSTIAPAAATISPANPTFCPPGGVTLTASVAGKSSYQWYRNNVEITGATSQTYTATTAGSYTVTYFDAPCVSQMSSAVVVTAKCYRLGDDYATVVENTWVEINVLNNDTLPSGFFSGTFSLCDSIAVQPVAGILSCTGTGANSRIIYSNTGVSSLINNIDSFTYRFRYTDPSTLATVEKTARVYIYVLSSAIGGFAGCQGLSATITLANKPVGVSFNWYQTQASATLIGTGRSRTTGVLMADSVYWLKPVMPAGPYQSADFPRGQLTVTALDNNSRQMRWTGMIDHNWHNPGNWVGINTSLNIEYPVSYEPTECVDVEIASDALYFPELTGTPTAVCRDIKLLNRALLKNPHALVYRNAQVELILGSTERDRFVMWSAPLMDVYSGDYHFKEGTTPVWGDIGLNFFQKANPSGGVASVNTFTATFGAPDAPLSLGTAFNVKVVSTTRSKGKAFVFPKTETSYQDEIHIIPYYVSRTNANRFVTDTVTLSGNTFNMPVWNDVVGSSLVQVVNPYLAYLDVSQFLAGNSAKLNPGGYIIWDGKINNSFTMVSTNGNRYVYTAPSLSTLPNLIPPLQSFFVQKSSAALINSVKMSPDWTTTTGNSPYVLRSAPEETGILRIKSTQGGNTSYAVLNYDTDASPAYNGKEDVYTLFFDENPLTVYSLTSAKEALSINTNGDFQSAPTGLGLRFASSGEVSLEFSGLETFGHDVFLIDKEKNQEINLQQTPSYTFTVKASARAMTEINDRFALRMEYTGNVSIKEIDDNLDLYVFAKDGWLDVWAIDKPIENLQIYNMLGSLIYSNNKASDSFRISLGGWQVYIVKALVGNEIKVKKVYLK